MNDIKRQNLYYKNNLLQQLRGFYLAALYNNFKKAADIMCISPSAVSMQIISLENKLGYNLFDRHGPKVRLTDKGNILLSIVEPIMDETQNIFQKFSIKSKQLQNQKIRIAAQHMCSIFVVPNILKIFKNEVEEIYIELYSCGPNQAVELLEKDLVDIVIGCYFNTPNNLIFNTFIRHKAVLIRSKDSKIKLVHPVKIEDIITEDFIYLEKEFFTLPYFLDIIKQLKVISKLKLISSNWLELKALVAANLGSACISTVCLESTDQLDVYPLDRHRQVDVCSVIRQ